MSHPAEAALAELAGWSLLRLIRHEDGPIGLILADAADHRSLLQVIAAGWRLTEDDELIDGSYHETDPERIGYAETLNGRIVDSIELTTKTDATVTLGSLVLTVWAAAAAETTLLWFRPDAESLTVGPGLSWQRLMLDHDHPLHEVGMLGLSALEH